MKIGVVALGLLMSTLRADHTDSLQTGSDRSRIAALEWEIKSLATAKAMQIDAESIYRAGADHQTALILNLVGSGLGAIAAIQAANNSSYYKYTLGASITFEVLAAVKEFKVAEHLRHAAKPATE